jgi:hypothetical protein
MTRRPITEPCPIADTFCAEIVGVETFGAFARLTFATTQRSAYMDNTEGPGLERVIVAKLIVPRDALQAMAEKMLVPTDLEKMASPGAAVARLVN